MSSSPLVLALETSGPRCSVALGRHGAVVATRAGREANDHSVVLTPLVEELLAEQGVDMRAIEVVAVSLGPGSYTGLRIGLSTAKGIAFALGVPLIGIPTLQLLAAELCGWLAGRAEGEKTLLYPMLDARREEVYTQPFTLDLHPLAFPTCHVLTETPLGEYGCGEFYYGGSGAQKAIPHLDASCWHFAEGVMPSARTMVSLANEKYHAHAYEDIAYCEPLYLKEFMAAAPKPSVLDAARAAHSHLPTGLRAD